MGRKRERDVTVPGPGPPGTGVAQWGWGTPSFLRQKEAVAPSDMCSRRAGRGHGSLEHPGAFLSDTKDKERAGA